MQNRYMCSVHIHSLYLLHKHTHTFPNGSLELIFRKPYIRKDICAISQGVYICVGLIVGILLHLEIYSHQLTHLHFFIF